MSHNIQELLSPNCALFFLFFLRNLFVNSTYWGIWLQAFRGFVVKISCPVSSEQHNVKQKEEQMWPQHKKYATMDTRTRPFISDQSLSFCRECFKCSQEILVPTSLLLISRLILTSLQNMILRDQDPLPPSYKIATKTLPFILSKPYGQGPTGRGFWVWDGTGRVLAKKFGYRDGSGWVMRKF